MSSAHHPDTCLSCPIHGVLHLVSSACHPQTHVHPHFVHMSSAHCLHAIRISSAHFPELPNSMQYYTWCHLHIICRHTCHLQHHLQICTAFAQSSWTPIVFPVPKILVIDVTVVPDLALLKTYCLHIICGSLHCPYGPQLCFLSQKY